MSEVEVHNVGSICLAGIEDYQIITCGAVRLDLQDRALSLHRVLRGWYLDETVKIEDLIEALQMARKLLRSREEK